ncbi:MAG: phosphoenolpyruvate synthase [Candidatus Yonathbacteria bacterium]|nr:phosphoenolpyruvate synthase [Candidatus Yonathbacteria bacterium]
MKKEKQLAIVLWLKDVDNDDVALVGGKNASLGEMYKELVPEGIRIPNAFIVTAHAYNLFIKSTGLAEMIEKELKGLDTRNVALLQRKGKKIRNAFMRKRLPKVVVDEIKAAYKTLSREYDVRATDVAVRSSATAEDLPGASFAGEHDTYLNIRGEEYVLRAVKSAFASLFTDRAISYRVDKGFKHTDVKLSVGIQKMVRSDKACSGVMFTLDTETGFRNVVEISSAWGLGEMVVQGKVTPDEFLVFKPSLEAGKQAILRRIPGDKRSKMIYGPTRGEPTRILPVPADERTVLTLTDEEVTKLAEWALIIEKHYTARAGQPRPMDMEWAKDGVSGELFIVQARPETVQSEKKGLSYTEYTLGKTGKKPIVEGISVGTKIASGKARVITDARRLDEFKDGEILIATITDPTYEPIMKKAAAIITEKGGRTSHAAIVSRELGIPAVIGTGNARKKISTGDLLTVDTSSGEVGRVYEGEIKWKERAYDLKRVPKPRTKLCLNVGDPENAFKLSFLPHHGVGLAREEFIIASHIGIHPLALIHFDEIKDWRIKEKIKQATEGYDDKAEFFVDKLAEGIAHIGAAFWPEQVIVRFSDFKTNEYRALLGGELYEPDEENPMIGWRGASRYAHPDYREGFKLEVEAMKRVRETMGITNVHAMIPFCRTPEEGQAVLDLMEKYGLPREKKKNGLKVYVMCEIPTNVIRADDFLDIFDGFSIGSNDLAQLTLGLDRDSAIIAGIGNENDESVKALVSQAIKACKRRKKYIGFCGQAPSDYPEFLRFLVGEKIEAISLNPDTVIPMTIEAAKAEKKR